MNVAEWVQSYGYAAVAAGTFLEGESVLLVAGAAAARGHLALPVVIAIAAFASFLGDQRCIYLGRASLWRCAAGALSSLRKPRAYVNGLLGRHHLLVILSIRFLYGLRVAGPIAIGMSRVSWSGLCCSWLAAILWALLIAGMRYWRWLRAGVSAQALIGLNELWGFRCCWCWGWGLVWWLLRRQHWKSQNLNGPHMRVLLVEDDAAVGEGHSGNLERSATPPVG